MIKTLTFSRLFLVHRVCATSERNRAAGENTAARNVI
jgi:hypothetical protein